MKNLKATPIVIVKPVAYYKMLIHVLRFGNKYRNENHYKEVMGTLVGHLEKKESIENVIVEDAVPVSHGGSIEVRFSNEQLGAFGQIDMEIWEKYGSKKWFTVGWYHSHPGLGCFFSATDIFNHLFWQDKNPSGIGIVFDHRYLEQPGNLGFKTYRLNDPSKNLNSGYYEVETIVEPPDNLNYYIKIVELIRSIHLKEVPILELNETPDFFDDIAVSDQYQINYKTPVFETDEITKAIQSGISNFIELSIKPLIQYLNIWSQGIIEKIVENNSRLKKALIAFKDEISEEISKLQNSFKNSLKDKINQLDSYIDDKLDGMDKSNIEINNSFSRVKEKLIEQLNVSFKEKVVESLNQSLKKFDESSKLIREFNKKKLIVSESLEQQQLSLIILSEKIGSLESVILDNYERNRKETEKKLIKKVENSSKFVNALNDKTENFTKTLEKTLSILEDSKTSLKSKFNALESENETFKTKIETLNSDKETLKAKIETLNSEKEHLQNQLKDIDSQHENLLNKIKEMEAKKQQ